MIAATGIPNQPIISIPKPTSIRRFPSLGFRLKPRNKLGFCRLSRADELERMGYLKRLTTGCFSCDLDEGKIVEVETVDGGEDVFDAATAEAKLQPEHLVIMVNGLIGSSSDWKYGAEEFVKRLPEKVIVHRSECNTSKLTFDGVDQMGERLANEVVDVVKRWPGVQKISFVAHSLGGLVARYAIGRLYGLFIKIEDTSQTECCSNKDSSVSGHLPKSCYESKIAGLEPMNFITFATPHLGSRGNKQLPFLCGLTLLEKGASQTAHWIAGRSGKHLFLTDNDDGKPPLLLRMVNDSDDLKFISALRSFKRRAVYANASYDHIVGWGTSSIRRQHELPRSNQLVKNEKYPHIFHVKQETTEDVKKKASSTAGKERTELEEEMIRGLTQVSWERIDVSFHKSRQRYVAHNTIQVKSYWLNSDGADVIQHMIDNFLV